MNDRTGKSKQLWGSSMCTQKTNKRKRGTAGINETNKMMNIFYRTTEETKYTSLSDHLMFKQAI